jgi:hypothetical protein
VQPSLTIFTVILNKSLKAAERVKKEREELEAKEVRFVFAPSLSATQPRPKKADREAKEVRCLSLLVPS